MQWRRIKTLWWVAIGVYALAFWVAYRATPSGQVAQLDAREQQLLARTIAEGALVPEPFYRAPLYAWMLSLFYQLGLGDAGVLFFGQLANLVLHLLTALGIYKTALLLWEDRRGALLAAGLYGFYPVALYLAGDLLDATLAQTLLAWGIYFLLRAIEQKTQNATRAGLLSGMILSLATLTRPQLLTVTLAAIVLLAIALRKEKSCAKPTAVAFGLGLLLVWGVFIGTELSRTGRFYLLPQQGGYNLYVANQAGREFFSQRLDIAALPEGVNPARAESEILYQEQTGRAPASHAEVERYWQGRFIEQVFSNPVEFLAGYLRKFYALFNVHEGYNNKTYSFQKAQNPILAQNPLNFTLVAAVALFSVLFFRPLPQTWRVVTLFAVVYALGAALFYPSDRFRSPLVLFACVLCGGATGAWVQLRERFRNAMSQGDFARALTLFVFVLASALPFWRVGRVDTTRADRLLGAQAALKVGRDHQSALEFQALADEGKTSSEIWEGLLQARYNLLLKGGETPTRAWCREGLEIFGKLHMPSPEARFIAGLCCYQLEGNRSAWRELVAASPITNAATENALAALLLTGPVEAQEILRLNEWKAISTPVQLSLAVVGEPSARELLIHKYGVKATQEALSGWQNLFDRKASARLND